MSEPKVTIIVAVEHSQRNLPAIAERIAGARTGSVEVIIVHTGNDAEVSGLMSKYSDVVTVEINAGSRIPVMWAEGIHRARAPLLVVTTAHCVPESDWIDKILALDMAPDLVAVGGVIRNSASASAMDWAIYFQRYRQYTPQEQAREVREIAADNAVYRKAAVLECDDLLARGFWEPEFHARFLKRGLHMRLDPALIVVHENCYTFAQFARQRIEHAMEFGRTRVARQSASRNLLLLLISPLLWLVFLRKVVAGAFHLEEYRVQLLRSLPWLIAFTACWGYGEGRGYLHEFIKRFSR